ncbi:MAG: UDP-2,3-diacylglucosamine diphosphatase LpxI [Alphaproteobacteria bacterium]
MPPKVGVVAGGGRLPELVARACRDAGRSVFLLSLRDDADPELAARVQPDGHAAIRLGEAGTGVKHLKRAGVEQVVFVGKVERPSLSSLRPDFATIGLLARIGRRALGDDSLLRAIADVIAGEGFQVVGPLDLAPGLATPEGVLTRARPDAEAEADIRRGIAVVAGLGACDVGQAAAVQQGIVLAVEAVEGTDAMIARCAALSRKGAGGVLVKASKPQQDLRLDLPTVGADTVRAAAQAGLRGMAIEAGRVILIDRAETVAEADRLGLFVVGVAVQAAPAP